MTRDGVVLPITACERLEGLPSTSSTRFVRCLRRPSMRRTSHADGRVLHVRPCTRHLGRDNAAPRILREPRHHCTRLEPPSARLSHRSKPVCRRVSDDQAPVDGRSPEDPLGLRDVPTLTMVEQIQELQAALSLNKSQLARVLRVGRPVPCGWPHDREPDATAELAEHVAHDRAAGQRGSCEAESAVRRDPGRLAFSNLLGSRSAERGAGSGKREAGSEELDT